MTVYDNHYRQANLFGKPYPEFVAFMRQWPARGTVLDVGCGQGRDALFLVELGFQVTGIDISRRGIEQMLAAASEHNLQLEGIVADIFTYDYSRNYDAILLDSILHFEKKNLARELSLLTTLTSCLNPNGLFCLFIHKSKTKEQKLRQFFARIRPNWPVLVEQHIPYTYEEPETGFRSSSHFYMLFVQNPLAAA